MGVKVVGTKTLDIKLDKLADADISQLLYKAGLMVEAEAKVLCPVDTGELRDSITTEVEGDECRVGTNKEYAPYVHQGTGIYAANGDGRQNVPWRYQDLNGNWHTTSGQKPQPFLANALINKEPEIKELLKNFVKDSVK